jgi:hypothetical protein
MKHHYHIGEIVEHHNDRYWYAENRQALFFRALLQKLNNTPQMPGNRTQLERFVDQWPESGKALPPETRNEIGIIVKHLKQAFTEQGKDLTTVRYEGRKKAITFRVVVPYV